MQHDVSCNPALGRAVAIGAGHWSLVPDDGLAVSCMVAVPAMKRVKGVSVNSCLNGMQDC